VTPPALWLRHVRLQTLLWLLIAVLLNHIASAWSIRVDATGDQRFTLSQAARDAVAALDKPLLAHVFFTSDLDPPYHEHAAALRDTLTALAAASGGHMEVRWTDPSGDPEAVEQAGRFGVRPITYALRSWDRQEARNVFMGCTLVYGDRQVPIPALTSVPRMEYDVVRAIRRITTPADETRRVGVLQGHGEPDWAQYGPNHPVGLLRARLSERWTLTSLTGTEPIEEDVAAVVVLAPQSPIPPVALYHLDQFLMRGGGLAVFLTGVQPDYASGVTRDVRHGLGGLLGAWGLAIQRGVLVDRASNERVALPAAGGVMQVNSPLAPVTTDIDDAFAPVRSLRRLTLPFAVPMTVADPLPPDIVADVWVATGPDTRARSVPAPLLPEALAKPADDERAGPFAAVVGLSGRFPTFFSGGPPPGGKGEHQARSQPARLVVAASGDAAPNAPDLVVNAVEWLTEDPSLAQIRARSSSAGLLKAPPASEALAWKLGIVGLPLTVLGLMGWFMSRRGRWS
jgi:hypothetical protein